MRLTLLVGDVFLQQRDFNLFGFYDLLVVGWFDTDAFGPICLQQALVVAATVRGTDQSDGVKSLTFRRDSEVSPVSTIPIWPM